MTLKSDLQHRLSSDDDFDRSAAMLEAVTALLVAGAAVVDSIEVAMNALESMLGSVPEAPD